MNRLGFAVVTLLSVLVAAYAVVTYGFGPGASRLPQEFQDNFGSRPWAVSAHIFASSFALLLGPIQFSTYIRLRWPVMHRLAGKLYLGLAVPIGGMAGLYLSGFAFGGIVSTLGFGCLAVVWLYTAVQGFLTAHHRNFSAHQRWMVRNYSLTFAAVTLRLYLTAVISLQLPFEVAYQTISWLCWVPNLIVAELLVQKTIHRTESV